jgi:hypothetical protein
MPCPLDHSDATGFDINNCKVRQLVAIRYASKIIATDAPY